MQLTAAYLGTLTPPWGHAVRDGNTCIATSVRVLSRALAPREIRQRACERLEGDIQMEPTSEGTTAPATQSHYRRRGLLVYASRYPGSQGDKADKATIPSRGQKTELVCRWSGVAVLVQTLETLLLRWAARRFQTGTTWPADRDLIGLCPSFFLDTATFTRWSRSLGAEASALRAPLALGEDPLRGS